MLKIVKSKARNRLSQGSLDQILRIKLESPGKLGDESLEELVMMFKRETVKQWVLPAAILVVFFDYFCYVFSRFSLVFSRFFLVFFVFQLVEM